LNKVNIPPVIIFKEKHAAASSAMVMVCAVGKKVMQSGAVV
jgi:hypothetical protein